MKEQQFVMHLCIGTKKGVKSSNVDNRRRKALGESSELCTVRRQAGKRQAGAWPSSAFSRQAWRPRPGHQPPLVRQARLQKVYPSGGKQPSTLRQQNFSLCRPSLTRSLWMLKRGFPAALRSCPATEISGSLPTSTMRSQHKR